MAMELQYLSVHLLKVLIFWRSLLNKTVKKIKKLNSNQQLGLELLNMIIIHLFQSVIMKVWHIKVLMAVL